MLIDIHAHLDMINKKYLKVILDDAKEKGIGKIISCSTSFESNKKNLELSEKFEEVEGAIGLYPLNAIELNEEELEKAFEFFKKNIDKAIAIGEIGLDLKYSKNNTEFEKQKMVFERFIELGKKYNKPLIIHSRYAQRQVIELLDEKKAEKVILHGFTESERLMNFAYKKGWFIGIGLNLLQSEQVQSNIQKFSLSNIFLETDSPIKFNEEEATPSKIKDLVEKISNIKGISAKEVESQIEENYLKLFRK